MATTTVKTTNEQQSTNRELRGIRARIEAFFSDSMQIAVAEGSQARIFGFPRSGRVVARNPDEGELPGAGSKSLRAPPARGVATLPGTTTGPGRKIARSILRASLTLTALSAAIALQAAIHVYVWRLAG